MPTTILAVDDSATMRKALAITFAGTEFNLVACDTAAAALAKVKTDQPALVIVDVSLPPSDGYELCTTIKLASPQLPVLMLSSKQNPFDPARGGQADAHVDKPFDTQMLADKVRELVAAAGMGVTARPAAAATAPAAAAQPLHQARPPAAAAHAPAPAAGPAPASAAGSRPRATAIGPSPIGARPLGSQPGAGPARMGPFAPPASSAGPTTPGPGSPTFKDTIPMAGKTTQDAAAQARAGLAAGRQAAAAEPKPAAAAAKPAAGPLGGWARPGAPAKPAAAAAPPAETPTPPTPAVAAEPEAAQRGRAALVGTLPGVPMQTGPQPVVKPAAGAPIRRNTVSSWPAPPPKEGVPEVQVPRAAAPAKELAAATDGLDRRLADLGLSSEQIEGVLALSREVVERVVWEVVPTLAETIIKEEIARLTQE